MCQRGQRRRAEVDRQAEAEPALALPGDGEPLAHGAVGAVAADQVARAKLAPGARHRVRQARGDAVAMLGERLQGGAVAQRFLCREASPSNLIRPSPFKPGTAFELAPCVW